MTVTGDGPVAFRRGLWWGLAVGLVLGLPAALALKAGGYPSHELYVWLGVLGVVYAAILVAVSLIAARSVASARGLAAGATLAMALGPLLVVIDIVAHSQ